MNMTDSSTHCCRKRSVIRRWIIGRKLRRLKLDHSQIEKLDELIINTRSACKGGLNAKSDLRECIVAMLADVDFNLDKATERIHKAAEQYAARTVDIVAAFGEFYQGLEPRQQEQLQGLLQRRRHCVSSCCH